MNAIISQGFTAHVTPLLPELIQMQQMQAREQGGEHARDLGFATIQMTGRRTAQGPVTRRYRDGRVTIDAGGLDITGHPIGGAAPKGWWASLTTSL